jgi:type I restriction enzyme S subunit
VSTTAKWQDTTLGQVADFLSGGTPSKDVSQYWEGTIPWVSAKDMKRFRLEDTEDHVSEDGVANGTKLVPLDTVLLLARGMTLLNDVPICVVKRAMTFNQDVKALRPKPGIRNDFLPYLLLGNKERLLSLVDLAGHGTGRLNSDELKALDVVLPPDPEQRAIAHILGTLDDKIELNRRMNETLEAMGRALFKSWFVDFDPVRAKMEGRWQRGQSLPGLPAHLYDLFPDRLIDSELGEIPEGWKVETLADHYQTAKGVSYKGSGLGDSGIPLHNLNSIYEGGGYKYAGIKYYSGDYAPRHVVQPGDVIVANTEQGHDRLLIGYAALVPILFGDSGIVSHHIYRLTPKAESPLTAVYLCWLLNSQRMHDTVSGYANGTTVNMLPIDGVQKPAIVLPPKPLVAAFDTVALRAARRREKLISESRTVAALRDTLLPKLISGELRVRDTAGPIREVA